MPDIGMTPGAPPETTQALLTRALLAKASRKLAIRHSDAHRAARERRLLDQSRHNLSQLSYDGILILVGELAANPERKAENELRAPERCFASDAEGVLSKLT
jgi:hypothetical protein